MNTKYFNGCDVTGTLVYGSGFIDLCDYFDGLFVKLAKRQGSIEQKYSSLISKQQLDEYEFFTNFPHLAHAVSAEKDSKYYLTPAVCYGCYPGLKNRKLSSGVVYTAKGNCYRQEDYYTDSPERLREFSMREIIFFGSKDFCENTRNSLMNKITLLARQKQINGEFEAAQDPFYSSAKGSAIIQKLKNLKYEFRVPAKSGKMAIASANLHEQFFTKRCNISLKSEECFSGCVAFGIERWAEALLQNDKVSRGHLPVKLRELL